MSGEKRSNSGGVSKGSAVNGSMLGVLAEEYERPSRENLVPHFSGSESPVLDSAFLLDLEEVLQGMPEPEISAAVLILQGESQRAVREALNCGQAVVQRARKLLQKGMREWMTS